ncbi:ATP binding L-PSP endoribonuclease family protein-like protein [Halenospora varia]|nr:ATP binding L-PSP endoribonuclease family protein-like protein [Halenospora varia]
MTESLNVIALISGGKDSFFSLLHCIQNGHKVVALANLYPPPTTRVARNNNVENGEADSEDEHDLNSFMYQTVGHTVIPLYEQALQIPLHRQPIMGTAVQVGVSYSNDAASAEDAEDETESLIPLLRRIIAENPGANALSTGAILSTYQRTRVESVALRLGLTPLSFLWKYPILPPGTQISLLQDMEHVGLDARIVKVASGGLDESFLWQNVAKPAVMKRIEKSMKRFGSEGDGAVLGEGGEFETLVIDGPRELFKGRIEVLEEDRSIVREGGGAAWLRIPKARVVMKEVDESTSPECRIPTLLEKRFQEVHDSLQGERQGGGCGESTTFLETSSSQRQVSKPLANFRHTDSLDYWNFSADRKAFGHSVSDQAMGLVDDIRQRLLSSSLQPTDITSTMIVLRSMDDFAVVNKIYGALFTKPNPPSRVTISCGDMLPTNKHLTIHLKVQKVAKSLQNSTPQRKSLHVQSRSYWAPANIGPYSQAISVPLQSSSENQESLTWTVSVAGQIPLIPHTMTLPPPRTDENTTPFEDFKLQATLSLQHLWRIGQEMNIAWWTSAVAYLPRSSSSTNSSRARIAAEAWKLLHRRKNDDEDSDNGEERDLWEEKHFAGMEHRGSGNTSRSLPDWELVRSEEHGEGEVFPPFFAVEVEELPRGSGVEWHAHLGVAGGAIKVS